MPIFPNSEILTHDPLMAPSLPLSPLADKHHNDKVQKSQRRPVHLIVLVTAAGFPELSNL